MRDASSPGALRWGVAATAEEREEVCAFRYEHYYRRLPGVAGVDHGTGRVCSQHDEGATHLTGRAADGSLIIVGTGVKASTQCLPPEWRTVLCLDRLSLLNLDKILIFSRLVEHEKFRGGSVFPAFFKYSTRYFVERGYAYGIHYCSPALVPLYELLGYRMYGQGYAIHPGLYRLPMILAVADGMYLKRVNPALAKALSDLAPAGTVDKLRSALPELGDTPLCARRDKDRLAYVRAILASSLPAGSGASLPDSAARPLRRASLLALRPGDVPAQAMDQPLFWFVLEGEMRLQDRGGKVSTAMPGTFINGYALSSFTAPAGGRVLVFAPPKIPPQIEHAALPADLWRFL
jgi:hypothetical protein